ncbi:fructose bisphosphate aldolase [Vagococcus penaei]|uniref:fructose bisphosphate aldolase n=1 Tax=Vagococcus penaei TaxID=633807 RepID=UPI001F01697D|nr:fructose bisphosphate aldolase [Vagococcus penaei]
MIDAQKIERMKHGKGFIAALDQSGGSTPKALKAYGIPENTYQTEEEMFDIVHDMRKRVITSPQFTSEHIIGAIIFEGTMKRKVGELYTADYLWDKKHILPFLKIDKGLALENDGVQLMKDIPNLDDILAEANNYHIFGTKQRSFISKANEHGIKDVVDQQITLAKKVFAANLIPTLEPEIDIHSPQKGEAEVILKKYLLEELDKLDDNTLVMVKLSLPNVPDFYKELIDHPKVLRVLALSGGYKRSEADKKLAQNHGMIASFSRALLEDLTYQETDFEFETNLRFEIQEIYGASVAED